MMEGLKRGGAAIVGSLATEKFGFNWKSNNLAVSRLGSARAVVLYPCTASMYFCRATVMRFSVPSSCTCRSRKFSFDFRSG